MFRRKMPLRTNTGGLLLGKDLEVSLAVILARGIATYAVPKSHRDDVKKKF